MIPEEVSVLVALAAYSGGCFCAGVAWAAYRAVGWVERIRRWADHASVSDGAPT